MAGHPDYERTLKKINDKFWAKYQQIRKDNLFYKKCAVIYKSIVFEMHLGAIALNSVLQYTYIHYHLLAFSVLFIIYII